jgi:hypothetical protein
VPLPASTASPDLPARHHLADRLMIAVDRRRVAPAVRLDRPAILAEFHDIFSHLVARLILLVRIRVYQL